jgi:DNA-binding LacI/PurR family transcriptional regulator
MARATIRDVARKSGVSVSTVSRVFTHPELFRVETCERVLAAAAELNYTPNRHAASLITGKTANVGLVVPNIANPFFPEMVKSAQHLARERGLAVLLADSDDSADEEANLIHALAKDVDGIVDFSSLLSARQIEDVSSLTPIVFVNRSVAGRRCVLIDAHQGMRLLVQYLKNLGHSAIQYLPGPENSWAAADRLQALITASSEAGLALDVGAHGPASFETGRDFAEHIVRSPLPSAVLCFNDIMALGVVARLLSLGVRIPEQVSVTGWGGTKMSGYYAPALTTVTVPFAELGRAAIEQVLLPETAEERLTTRHTLFDVSLTARATTGRAAGS